MSEKKSGIMSAADIRELLAEVAKSQKETGMQIKELRASQKETGMQIKEMAVEISRLQKETGLQIKEMAAEIGRLQKETDRQLKKLSADLDKYGMVQGEIAEDMFRRGAPAMLEKEGIRVDRIITNLKEDDGREYDIVAVNGSEVVVFEIKNKLRTKDILHFYNEQLPDFKRCFPRYQNYKVYGGIGALVVKKSLEKEAHKKGLFVLTQGGDGNALLHRPPRLLCW